MKLTKLKVSNLFGHKNIEWNFNPNSRINILVGNNGCGKSTLLDIIASILAGSRFDSEFKHKLEDRFESASLYYNDCDDDNNKEQVNDKHIQLNPKHSKQLQLWCSDISGYNVNDFAYSFQLSNLTSEQLDSYVRIANDFFEMHDKELKVTHSFQRGQIQPIVADKKTGKQFCVYVVPSLSIGERELLKIILFTVALNQHPHSFIFLHCPEAHLHLNWQENLISKLIELNPNAQFFIKTHSPAIIMNGWNDAYVDMNDLTKKHC